MMMKISFVILAVSLVAVLVIAVALLWRLRWHLRRSRSDDVVKNASSRIEPAEKSNHS